MSPRKVDRMTRVNELIKRELGGLIEEDRMWAGNILVSVTEVNTGTDLRNATVGISIFGGTASEKQKIMAELNSRKPKWQEDLAAELGFKHTPVPEMGVKASGGVRSYADAVAMIEAGANRLGASSGKAIVDGCK